LVGQISAQNQVCRSAQFSKGSLFWVDSTHFSSCMAWK